MTGSQNPYGTQFFPVHIPFHHKAPESEVKAWRQENFSKTILALSITIAWNIQITCILGSNIQYRCFIIAL